MKRGHQLKKEVKAAVEALVRTGKLGLNPDCCQVFRNKGYFSKDRGSEIKVDVSIELIPPGTSEPSLIWIWECKDYAGFCAGG